MYILNTKTISVTWHIYKGVSSVHEDFGGAEITLFLETPNCIKDIKDFSVKEGVVTFSISGLDKFSVGNYSIYCVWVNKNGKTSRCKEENAFTTTDAESKDNSGSAYPSLTISTYAITYGFDGLSAYEIAVKYGYTGTEKEWLLSNATNPCGMWYSTTTYKRLDYVTYNYDGYIALKESTGVVPLGNPSYWSQATDLSGLVNNIKAEEAVWIKNESKRESNETKRNATYDAVVSAESTRVSNEEIRINAENERLSAENKRLSAEESRSEAESARISNEKDRKSSEDTRKSNEQTRIANENERLSNENTRKYNESTRLSNEDSRIKGENSRVSSENTRISNEDSRKSAENKRVAAENARSSAESSRESAEKSRSNSESSRVSNENDRISNENTRKSNEDSRIASENERKSNEDERNSNEDTRISNEKSRLNAEDSRVSAEKSRAAAEVLRASSEDDREKAEATRESNETARQTNTATAISNAEAATSKANESAKHQPKPIDGTWWVWSADENKYVDTKESSCGYELTEEKILSAMPNLDTVNKISLGDYKIAVVAEAGNDANTIYFVV